MRVLFLVNIPSPYRVEFFNLLGQRVDLTVLYVRREAANRDKKWISEDARRTYQEVFLSGIRVGEESGINFACLKYLSMNKYDIIVIGGYHIPTCQLAILYMRMRSIPFFICADGGFIKQENRALYLYKKALISSAAGWLSTGDYTKQFLAHYGADIRRVYQHPFSSVHNYEVLGSPVTREEKSAIKKRLGIRDQLMIISVGQVIYRKGYDILLEGVKGCLESVQVYVIGGEASAELLGLLDEGSDQVHFLPFMSRAKLFEYYKAADLFVFPTREDVWGLVLNEAFAFGLPIIASDRCIAALEMIRQDVNGYVVPVENVGLLKEKVVELVSNREKLSNMATECLKTAREYTLESMADAHNEIFANYLEIQ